MEQEGLHMSERSWVINGLPQNMAHTVRSPGLEHTYVP